MGKGNGKIIAVLLTSTLGGYIGNKIGAKLDDQDRQALAQRTQDVLNQPASAAGQPVKWNSAHSGATAEIVQGKEFTDTKTVEVKRAPKIAAVPSLKLINEPYMTKSSSNVRSAPNKNAGKVGGLQPGTEFTAVGSTGDWILVGRKGCDRGLCAQQPEVRASLWRWPRTSNRPANLDEMNVSADKENPCL